jgi:CrcB protein
VTGNRLLNFILIAAGGALGSVLRYAMSGWTQNAALHGPLPLFPWGILLVNAVGCLAIGVLTALFMGPFIVRQEYQNFLIVGVLGGYTTFSSFGRDTIMLVQSGQPVLAGLNIVFSNVLGLLAVWAGMAAVRFRYGG